MPEVVAKKFVVDGRNVLFFTRAIEVPSLEVAPAVLVTVVSLTAASTLQAKVFLSNDIQNWAEDTSASLSFSAAGSNSMRTTRGGFKFIRIQFELTAGASPRAILEAVVNFEPL